MILAHCVVDLRRQSLVLLLVGGIGVATCCSCSVQQSQLLSDRALLAGAAGVAGVAGVAGAVGIDPQLGIAGAGPVTPAVRDAIDERPIGGASLTGGTTGGGSYADALAKGQLHYVDSVQGIRDLISSNTAATLLIAEGTYSFATTAKPQITVCNQTCSPTTPLAQQLSSNCTNGESTFQIDDTLEFLRFGNNKTLLGLGKGAVFKNAMISLSNVTNIILRNLDIEDVGNNVNGQGYAINLWPGDHVWVDHCTFRNIGRSYFNVSSTLDNENAQKTLVETGYVTITHNYFDGKMDNVCGQRAPSVLGTCQVSALTIANNWFHRSSRYNVSVFGPSTWAHVFNNYWSDIDRQGMGVICGATALAQGNVFEATTSALFSSDSGASNYPFCSTGLYGKFYAPMGSSTEEDNLVDGSSTLALNGQPTDGTGLTKPVRLSGHTFTIATPTNAGASIETYEFTLIADPSTVAAQVKTEAGAGTLF